jgi:ABC-type transport system involved in multi-copper enzyme maturation permease subunit
MNRIALIARLTFHEARRRKIMWAAVLLGLAFLAIYALGLYFLRGEILEGMEQYPQGALTGLNMLVMMALYAVNFLIIVMTVLTSVDTIAGEVASGAIHAIAAKPIRRAEILLGKWLGFAVMLVLYAALMIGGVVLATRLLTNYTPPNILRGSLLMILEGFIVLHLSLLGGTFLSTLANGVFVLGLFGVAFIGGWMEQFGAMMHNETVVNIGILSSLVMPSEAIWRWAAYLMQPPILRTFNVSPFGSNAQPSLAMVVYTLAYLAAALAFAIRNFSRKDL